MNTDLQVPVLVRHAPFNRKDKKKGADIPDGERELWLRVATIRAPMVVGSVGLPVLPF
jgi:hypothetical protein